MSHGCLQIATQEGGLIYNFSLTLPESGTVQASRVISPARWDQLRRGLAALSENSPFGRLSEDQLRMGIGTLGSQLRALVPAEVLEGLEQLDLKSRLTLKVQDCPLPWELMEVNNTALSCRVMLSRWQAERPLPPCGLSPRRALLVLDPEGLQPWAAEWAAALARALGESWQVEILAGPRATVAGLREALSRPCALLHMHVYGEYQESAPQLSRLFLADGSLSMESFAHGYSVVPGLAVLHLSLAGNPRPGCPGAPLASYWGRAVGAMGIPAVLVNGWDIEPPAGLEFFQRFYRALGEGREIGAALRDNRNLSGLAFLATGDLSRTGDQLTPFQRQEQATQEAVYRATHSLVVRKGPRWGEEFPLMLEMLVMAGPLTIGGPGPQECDLELDDVDAANPAAFLSLEDGELALVPGPGVELKVNGLPIFSKTRLAVGAVVEVGATTLELCERAKSGSAPPVKAGASHFELLVEQGPEQGQRVAVDDQIFTVGRQSDCHLVLKDPAVSRRQFTILSRDGEQYASPVGSAPMFLNGVLVEREVRLSGGDLLRVGNETILRFRRVGT